MAETCEHCGRPLHFGFMWLTSAQRCERVALPGRCLSEECRAGRDNAAIADGIARGVIDP